MRKIPTLFERDWDGDRSRVLRQVNPGAAWVVEGEGVATRKLDGTAAMIRAGVLFKRYDAKEGRSPPHGFEPAQDPDPETGHWPGWIPAGNGPEDRWLQEAYALAPSWPDGTYELVGPKVRSNPEGYTVNVLVRHGFFLLPDAPRDFDGLRSYFEMYDFEGIVWWREEGNPEADMAKIKARDFGIRRGPR